jgi:Zn-dependent alcohol dehydrogenase
VEQHGWRRGAAAGHQAGPPLVTRPAAQARGLGSRVPELVDLYTRGELDLESLVTKRVGLDGANDAFEAMERQDGIRTVITY